MRSHARQQSRRLVLGELAREDAPKVRRLAGAREIARMTLLIPHPCTRREHYEKWGEYGDQLEYGLPAGEWRAAQGFCRGRA